jgi:hypothetical protein
MQVGKEEACYFYIVVELVGSPKVTHFHHWERRREVVLKLLQRVLQSLVFQQLLNAEKSLVNLFMLEVYSPQ